MNIIIDDLTGNEIAQLLQEHLTAMHLESPPESVHALDLTALRQPDITFWTVWQEAELMGCGALKALSPTHGEVKSMRTATAHLRKGVADYLFSHLITVAKHRGYQRLSLETGSTPAFLPAHQLYLRHGFVVCGPFADYAEDPFSIFMTRSLVQ